MLSPRQLEYANRVMREIASDFQASTGIKLAIYRYWTRGEKAAIEGTPFVHLWGQG